MFCKIEKIRTSVRRIISQIGTKVDKDKGIENAKPHLRFQLESQALEWIHGFNIGINRDIFMCDIIHTQMSTSRDGSLQC